MNGACFNQRFHFTGCEGMLGVGQDAAAFPDHETADAVFAHKALRPVCNGGPTPGTAADLLAHWWEQ